MSAQPRRLIVAVTIAIVATACGRVASVPEGTEPPLTGSESAAPVQTFLKAPGPTMAPRQADKCIAISIPTDFTPMTVKSIATASALVVKGTFQGYGAAIWNTPDGHRATWDEVGAGARLVTPLSIAVDSTIRGDSDNRSQIVQRGGTSGCDSMIYSDVQDIPKGASNLFFVGHVYDGTNTIAAFLMLVEAWPIDSDGNVMTPSEGTIPLSEVLSEIKATPYEGDPATTK